MSEMSSILFKELSSQMKDIWENFEAENKEKLQSEFMMIFSDVWRESVSIYNRVMANQIPNSIEESQPEEKDVVAEEKMEEAEIRYEATLIAVTTKRKEYPDRIAKLLGKKRRLEKNTAEVMKVDLGHRTPREHQDRIYSVESNAVMEDNASSFSESIQCLQPHLQRLANLVDVAGALGNIEPDCVWKSPTSKSS
ncbi:hypothetical protein SK128_028196 [Halocaridina rubra]|uniref:Uncharacterized protein n=1 Tax=Halocaridina rubra TaxID=373956 RepID=A0AAN8X218_HALRR